jgi:hypothetical protein
VDTPDGLREVIRSRQFTEVAFEEGGPKAGDLEAVPAVRQVVEEAGGFRLLTEIPGRVAAETVRFADSKGWGISHICTCKPSLEEVFLHLTGDGGTASDGHMIADGRQEAST